MFVGLSLLLLSASYRSRWNSCCPSSSPLTCRLVDAVLTGAAAARQISSRGPTNHHSKAFAHRRHTNTSESRYKGYISARKLIPPDYSDSRASILRLIPISHYTMTSYKPMILSSQLWLSVLALCFYASEVSAKVHTHYHATTNKICYDKWVSFSPCSQPRAHLSTSTCFRNHKVIPCPKSKKNLIIGLIIAGSRTSSLLALSSLNGPDLVNSRNLTVIGVFVLGGILYCCCCAGEVACATCAACCCLCCGKRKKTSGGQVYQTLPEQGNNATIVSLLPLFHFSYTDSPPCSTRCTYYL